MTYKKFAPGLAALAVAAGLAGASGAQGQSLALTGAAPAGLCSFNGARAVADSTAGRNVSSRLNELATQVKAELEAEQTSIQNDGQTLEAQKSSLSAQTYQSRGEALQARVVTLQKKAQLREAEMQATQRKALQTIEQALAPVVQQTATERHCTVLLSADSQVLPNPSIDITDAALASLNAKLAPFPVEREHLDQGQAAQ
jgi:outer membrane protein